MTRTWRTVTMVGIALFALSLIGDHAVRSADQDAREKLLAKFRDSNDIERQLELLADIESAFLDDELPEDVKYLLAMKLIRPHLSWHAAYAPRKSEPLVNGLRIYDRQQASKSRALVNEWKWYGAHAGETWMHADVPEAVKQDYLRAKSALAVQESEAKDADDASAKSIKKDEANDSSFFWRLRNPEHAEIERAKSLLKSVTGEDWKVQAKHWLVELERNNSIMTLDVAGGYFSDIDKPVPIVMDVRNVDRVKFSLYRVRDAQDLVAVCDRIGEDFVFVDYGLHRNGLIRRGGLSIHESLQALEQWSDLRRSVAAPPKFGREDLVKQWSVNVADLKPLDLHRDQLRRQYADEEGWDDEESDYFGDRDERYRSRIEKDYCPRRNELSSWRCDRLVEIPKSAIEKPGGYVLVAEGNRQSSYVPLLIDPLTMTMRRCRDGVMAAVSDATGKMPVQQASIHASDALEDSQTDEAGIAFARIFASGDRAIVAAKDGRYAIGGFGELFDGVYENIFDRIAADNWHRGFARQERLRRARTGDHRDLAHVFADRLVVAAYTARPTYRPGQQVQFKVILRKLMVNQEQDKKLVGFRASEFDELRTFELLPADTQVRYEILDPDGRVIGGGRFAVNEFGTASDTIQLSAEARTGTYRLRINWDGLDRIVPGVFAVKYYRRPNFEVQLTGLPGEITGGQRLDLSVSGNYFFGKPVSGGTVNAVLVAARDWRPLVTRRVTLDKNGTSEFELKIPRRIAGGDYRFVCSLQDESGRTATETIHCQVISSSASTSWSKLPQFVPYDEPLKLSSNGKQISVVYSDDKKKEPLEFPVRKKTANIVFEQPGWYVLDDGILRAAIFAYGEGQRPVRSPIAYEELQNRDDERRDLVPRWVNLSDYAYEEDEPDGWPRQTNRRTKHDLWVLFDRRQVPVGDTLRLLVYTPGKDARLLFTYEGRTVVDYYVAEIDHHAGAYQVVNLPITERHLSNFYLQGCLLAGWSFSPRLEGHAKALEQQMEEIGDGSEDPNWCRIDVIDPNARPGGQKLNVQVETAKQDYRPGEEVKVDIRVSDLAGRPAVAEVSLAAIDASVYSFGEDGLDLLPYSFTNPRPQRRYFRKTWRIAPPGPVPGEKQFIEEIERAAEMRRAMQQQSRAIEQMAQATASNSLATQLPDSFQSESVLVAGAYPVASFAAPQLRADFRETATWQPHLRTDEHGLAQATFELPDSLSRYRLTAVGVTRDSELGVGRAELQVNLPLAVQVFAPRFAVEGDQLELIAIVHNNSNEEVAGQVTIAVGNVEINRATRRHWTVAEEKNVSTLSQDIVILPGKSARLPFTVRIASTHDVSLDVQVLSDEHSDRVVRNLPVLAKGRDREVALNGAMTKVKEFTLPAGFVTQNLRVSVSTTDLAGSMDGLEYLIDYPYGCVEQTMSRFLPAVMAKFATEQLPLALTEDAEKKLPDVLTKGLARLYDFQHSDGGWGWWEHDPTNDGMTVYVVYGLARCQSAGTKVDETVLKRGCDYLQQRVDGGELKYPLAAQAWYVLALAKRAGLDAFQKYLRSSDLKEISPESFANLLLACHELGLDKQAQSFLPVLKDWKAETTLQMSLQLNAMVVMQASLGERRQIATEIMARRQGHRWESTRDTSAAIESLCQMLRHDKPTEPPRRVTIRVGSEIVADIRDKTQLDKSVFQIVLDRSQLPTTDGLPIEISVDTQRPASYSITATGVQRLDKMLPWDDGIQVLRTVTDLSGRPIDRPLRVGEIVAVRLELELAKAQSYLIVEDRRPASCEFVDDELTGTASKDAAHVEFRDDRVCIFITHLRPGKHELTYYLRAETRGTTTVLPAVCYPMYNEKHIGGTDGLTIIVK